MNIPALVEEIGQFLSEHGNPETVAKYKGYFKEGYDAYGVPGDTLKTFRKEWAKAHPMEMDQWLQLVDRLWESDKYEAGTLAILWTVPFAKKFTPESLPMLHGWITRGIRNWAHSDCFCSEITHRCHKKGIFTMTDFTDWRSDKNRWVRRVTAVSMLALLKTPVDPESLLSFLDPMMTDQERVVHQGIGWFLRELWKQHPGPVEAFLHKHKPHAARLIVQYATEKMSKDQRLAFRKPKG